MASQSNRARPPPLRSIAADLVVQRPEGLYCPAGDFYIDPWRPVDRAVITHAHADHSRRGHAHYLAAAPSEGVLRTRLGEIDLQFLAGGKPRQVVSTAVLRALACRCAGIDDWLFDASYQAVGDFAETVAHILPPPARQSDLGLAEWIEARLLPLRGADPLAQAERIAAWWDELDAAGRFLLTKLIGGGFRVGVSRLLVQRALAENASIDATLVAQRMMGYTDGRAMPSADRYLQLTASATSPLLDLGQPYPFFLAHPLEFPLAELEERLGSSADWIVEWKYDGIPQCAPAHVAAASSRPTGTASAQQPRRFSF